MHDRRRQAARRRSRRVHDHRVAERQHRLQAGAERRTDVHDREGTADGDRAEPGDHVRSGDAEFRRHLLRLRPRGDGGRPHGQRDLHVRRYRQHELRTLDHAADARRQLLDHTRRAEQRQLRDRLRRRHLHDQRGVGEHDGRLLRVSERHAEPGAGRAAGRLRGRPQQAVRAGPVGHDQRHEPDRGADRNERTVPAAQLLRVQGRAAHRRDRSRDASLHADRGRHRHALLRPRPSNPGQR